MKRLPVLIGVLALSVALLTDSGYGQDKKQDDAKKDNQPPGKVQLPTGWGKLGITGDQKKKILDVVGTYQAKIANLRDQIDKLKSEEYVEAFKLLNDDQKAILKKIADAKADPTIKDKKGK